MFLQVLRAVRTLQWHVSQGTAGVQARVQQQPELLASGLRESRIQRHTSPALMTGQGSQKWWHDL